MQKPERFIYGCVVCFYVGFIMKITAIQYVIILIAILLSGSGMFMMSYKRYRRIGHRYSILYSYIITWLYIIACIMVILLFLLFL